MLRLHLGQVTWALLPWMSLLPVMHPLVMLDLLLAPKLELPPVQAWALLPRMSLLLPVMHPLVMMHLPGLSLVQKLRPCQPPGRLDLLQLKSQHPLLLQQLESQQWLLAAVILQRLFYTSEGPKTIPETQGRIGRQHHIISLHESCGG